MELKFPSFNDVKFAEFVGILLWDGCIGIYDCHCRSILKKQYQTKITLDSRNYGYIKYVEDLIVYLFGIAPKTYYKKGEHTADIRIFRKDVLLFLNKEVGLKLSPKWGVAEIPENFMKKEL